MLRVFLTKPRCVYIEVAKICTTVYDNDILVAKNIINVFLKLIQGDLLF